MSKFFTYSDRSRPNRVAINISSGRPKKTDYSSVRGRHLDQAINQEYVRAGAAKNMLPLCWGIDGALDFKPYLCRSAALRGKKYCEVHASLEE